LKVIGWDAAGVVTLALMSRFSNLATRYFMLVRGRPGTNAEYHLVDERTSA